MSRIYLYLLCALTTVTVQATDKAGKDPTAPERWAPTVASSELAEDPVLSSVLIGSQRKLVVIDGHLMREGEQFGSVKVWRIEADHAVVSIGGRNRTKLWLDKHDMNKEVQ